MQPLSDEAAATDGFICGLRGMVPDRFLSFLLSR
jgi:hypothetical protein